MNSQFNVGFDTKTLLKMIARSDNQLSHPFCKWHVCEIAIRRSVKRLPTHSHNCHMWQDSHLLHQSSIRFNMYWVHCLSIIHVVYTLSTHQVIRDMHMYQNSLNITRCKPIQTKKTKLLASCTYEFVAQLPQMYIWLHMPDSQVNHGYSFVIRMDRAIQFSCFSSRDFGLNCLLV